MPTRNIVLTSHQSSFIEGLVASGRYQNASEVMREGLRLVEDREAENAAKLLALKAQVQLGMDDVASGRFSTFETPAALQSHLAKLSLRKLSAST